jgi:hypothetical protein
MAGATAMAGEVSISRAARPIATNCGRYSRHSCHNCRSRGGGVAVWIAPQLRRRKQQSASSKPKVNALHLLPLLAFHVMHWQHRPKL